MKRRCCDTPQNTNPFNQFRSFICNVAGMTSSFPVKSKKVSLFLVSPFQRYLKYSMRAVRHLTIPINSP